MAWDPRQYHKFQGERMAPFADVVALGSWRPGLNIVDLGCGTGELTARLADLSEGADILGIDSSASMLAESARHMRPGLRFAKQAIESFVPEVPLDVLFSHAALQWLDDHPALFRRLAGHLLIGGQLLVQMPSNHDHVSHLIVRELAATPPWPDRLGGFVRHSPVLSIDSYAELLYALGFDRPIVLEKVYGHVLADADAVLEWVRGTLLVPYLERLGEAHRDEFLDAIRAHYQAAMPTRPYYYAFRRTLIAATKTNSISLR